MGGWVGGWVSRHYCSDVDEWTYRPYGPQGPSFGAVALDVTLTKFLADDVPVPWLDECLGVGGCVGAPAVHLVGVSWWVDE